MTTGGSLRGLFADHTAFKTLSAPLASYLKKAGQIAHATKSRCTIYLVNSIRICSTGKELLDLILLTIQRGEVEL